MFSRSVAKGPYVPAASECPPQSLIYVNDGVQRMSEGNHVFCCRHHKLNAFHAFMVRCTPMPVYAVQCSLVLFGGRQSGAGSII